MDPLSNLHLRPSEQALVKIVNINMDKTKISEFIREQRMATDKATGVNLHNNKYHTQCLITFGNLKYDISIMKPPLCCAKSYKNPDIWSVKSQREHQNSSTDLSDNYLSHVFKSISVVNCGVWGSVRGLTNIGTESRHLPPRSVWSHIWKESGEAIRGTVYALELSPNCNKRQGYL